MGLIKNKELLGQESKKMVVGHVAIQPNKEQWDMLKEKKLKMKQIPNETRTFINANGEKSLTLGVRQGKKTTILTITGETEIAEVLDVFKDLYAIPMKITYTHKIGESKKILDMEIIDL